MAKDRRDFGAWSPTNLRWRAFRLAGVFAAVTGLGVFAVLTTAKGVWETAILAAGFLSLCLGTLVFLELLHMLRHFDAAEQALEDKTKALAQDRAILEKRLSLQQQEDVERTLAQENQVNSRLKQLEQAKTDFVSTVSHELRSPLTSTLGYLELLADGDAGTLDPEQLRMVEIASRNAKRLQGLIEDLLTLSRIESGSFRLRFKPVDIESVILAAAERSMKEAAIRNVDMNVSVEQPLGMCPGESSQLTKALDSLLDNAVKFTPSGGSVKLDVRSGDNAVFITVSDDGIGIPPEEQAKLFDRFFRATLAVEQAHHGTGLGLTIARAIVEHHGGTIAIDSAVGVGTTVLMTLPALPVDTLHSPTEGGHDAIVTSETVEEELPALSVSAEPVFDAAVETESGESELFAESDHLAGSARFLGSPPPDEAVTGEPEPQAPEPMMAGAGAVTDAEPAMAEPLVVPEPTLPTAEG